MSIKHLPEPWMAVHKTGPLVRIDGWCIYTDDDVKVPIAIVPEPLTGGKRDKNGFSPYQKANARRIVAAVNACAGISTKALEQGVIKDLLEACNAKEE